MNSSFNVTLNKRIIYTYTDKKAPARLRRFFDEIDNDMQQGIQLGDAWLENPDDFQKLQYVAMKLFSVIEAKDHNQIEVLSAYISNRRAELKEINIVEKDDLINIKLI